MRRSFENQQALVNYKYNNNPYLVIIGMSSTQGNEDCKESNGMQEQVIIIIIIKALCPN